MENNKKKKPIDSKLLTKLAIRIILTIFDWLDWF
jgi:hypothetical protein